MSEQEDKGISAEPTKAFFVTMLTRDIPLEQAILDLVDNSVDAAKSMKKNEKLSFEGRTVTIEFNSDYFRIADNCGGFDRSIAASYAFRFGRPPGAQRIAHSIGQFGVGMKRALFKFGHQFQVRSATAADSWAVDVNVLEWEESEGWSFPWGTFSPDKFVSNDIPGTEIVVKNLRAEVSNRFATKNFESSILGLIKSKHRQFIADGLSISVNGHHADATSLKLLMVEDPKLALRPGTDHLTFREEGVAETTARIIVGISDSSPREAGWYVVCNGRVILEADRRKDIGWGVMEEESNSLLIPNYHNQYARFRGIVYFDSEDSSRVPWNTTKTDIDQDNAIWLRTKGRMLEMMRPVLTFLNELDNDIDEHTKHTSPLNDYVIRAQSVATEKLPAKSAFSAPTRTAVYKGPKTIKIQYSRPIDDVNFLMAELGVSTAKAVGEKTFDLIHERMEGE